LVRLKEKGVEVVLVENSRADTFLTKRVENAGIPIINLLPENITGEGIKKKLLNTYYYHFANYKKLWNKVLDEIKPDILHVNTSPRLMKGIQFPAEKIVYAFHSDVRRGLSIYGKECERYLQDLAKKKMTFFSLSKSMGEDIHQLFQTENIVYIPNGVEIEHIRKYRYDRTEFLSSIGVDPNAFIVGQVGRIDPVKNHQKSLAVFKEILNRKPNSKLIIVGSKRTEHYKTIAEQAITEGIYDSIVFLGERDDATKVMGAFDVLIHPSISESFSLVLVEAQALGIRCVASTAVPEDVLCNANCLTLSLSDSDSVWADACIGDNIVDNKNDLYLFDIESVTEHMITAYESIYAKSRR